MALDFERVLTDLGLSANEARVYLSALELGATTALKISRHTGIKRSTVYARLKSLAEKGLINIQASGSKRRFAAENPERLESLLEHRRAQLKGVLPKLSAQFYNIRESESFIKHYHGADGIKVVYERFLKKLRPGDFYYAISNQEKLFGTDPGFFEVFSEKRRQIDLDFRLILQDNEHARTYRAEDRKSQKVLRYLPPDKEVNTCIIILPLEVIIVQLVEPIMAMVIENPHVVHSNRMMFEMMWDELRPPE